MSVVDKGMTEKSQTEQDVAVATKETRAFGRVAVLCGGLSPERQVSLQSGNRIFTALKERGVDVVLVDAGNDLVEQLHSIRPERVFLALHGGEGEDGTVQGLLDYLHIPYTGSGVKASALAMDKCRSKWIWNSLNLPTPDFAMVSTLAELDAVEIPLPCFVKPNGEGSSICTFPAYTKEELHDAVAKVLEHADQAMIEQLISGPEFTVAILNGQSLPVIRLETDNTFYDYEAKYLSDETRYHLPSGLTDEKEKELQALAVKAFDGLGCSGWGRVDVMQDEVGNFWLLEVNTIPGMTTHSLVPMAARAVGYQFEDLVLELLRTSGGENRSWMPDDISGMTAEIS